MMRERDLECLLIYSQKRGHVTYVSGYRPDYQVNAAMVVLPLKHEPVLYAKFAFDLERARQQSWFRQVRGSCPATTAQMVKECTEAVRSLGFGKSRLGLVAADDFVDEMSVSAYQHIRAGLPHAHLECASDLLLKLRLAKSEDEVKNLHEAAQLADAVSDCLREAISPGKKVRCSTDQAEAMARREGANQCFILLSADPSSAAVVPTSAEFHSQSLINCEISVQLHEYWVQICRIYRIGRPSAEQDQVFAACRKAYESARAAACAGNSAAAVAEAAESIIRQSGYEAYQYGIGHGVGLDLPEIYSVDRECRELLFPNLVLVLHPSIWRPPEAAAFVGGPILITEKGPVTLDRPQSEIIEI
jgi:Xaa-Pro aminopeptidase